MTTGGENGIERKKNCHTSTLDAIPFQTEAMKSFYRAAKGSAPVGCVRACVCVCVCLVSDASAFEGVLLNTIQTMRKMCNTYVSSSFHPHAMPDKQTIFIQNSGARVSEADTKRCLRHSMWILRAHLIGFRTALLQLSLPPPSQHIHTVVCFHCCLYAL